MKRFLLILMCLVPLGCTKAASQQDMSKVVNVVSKMDQKIDVVDGKVERLESRVSVVESGSRQSSQTTKSTCEKPSVVVVVPSGFVGSNPTGQDGGKLDRLHNKYDEYLRKNK